MATPQAIKRITRELAEIKALNSPVFEAGPKSESDLLNWNIEIKGPKGTPYEGGIFKLDLILPSQYPFHPPTLTFITKIYHPNVLPDGTMCIPLLKSDQWKPACKLASIIDIAVSLLSEPDGNEAIEGDAADVWKNDRKKFEKTAKDYTKRYAK
ncbi:ubiquitin-conjugating enzyme/RWD-like protein [Dipodascopsis uninucleata]